MVIGHLFQISHGGYLGYSAELVEGSPKKVLYRLSPPCLWFPELDIPRTCCRALGAFEKEAAKIINPGIKTYFTRLMTNGDPYCELIFEEVEG